MKEKELRLALVCYGGISLAVYMHGVTKEILKLARASRAYHDISDLAARRDARFADTLGADDDPCDTEEIYFELLKQIGEKLDLRVIVDVIAGASAGGINAVMLGRALAHDLKFEHMRETWLTQADVTELIAATRRAKKWSKAFMRPLVWLFAKLKLGQLDFDEEFLGKLSFFVRSRWFEPPFDGEHLLGMIYDALEATGRAGDAKTSLLPHGHRLELFVTLTDFFGYARHIELHDPPVVSEREHRHILKFAYQRWRSGELISEFDDECLAHLAFAGRATASYPGAFPPAQLSEIERLLKRRKLAWHGRHRFLESNFPQYRAARMDPFQTSFVDGSVLNNKPFEPAINSIHDRPAYRDVDRRIVYIDPTPGSEAPPPSGKIPGFFRVLKGVLSDIPRNEPVHDDLNWIKDFNRRVESMSTIIEAAKPYVWQIVEDLTKRRLVRPPTLRNIRRWRDQANGRAAHDAGFAYEGYVRLKLSSVLENGARLMTALCGHQENTPEHILIRRTVLHWAQQREILPAAGAVPLAKPGTREANLPPWVQFLIAYDIEYRRRRIKFIIQQINQLYGRLDEADFKAMRSEQLDTLKMKFYGALDLLRAFDNADFVRARTGVRVRSLFSHAFPDGASDIEDETFVKTFAENHLDALDDITDQLAREIDLAGIDDYIDQVFASDELAAWSVTARREILIAYLGFAYWDLITFSLTNWQDLNEFNKILVDRISPEDCNSIRGGGAEKTLKGIQLQNFGAFFSRTHRENDYLWGRFHGAERLIDILVSAAAIEDADSGLNVMALKKRAFQCILKTERGKLRRSRHNLSRIEQEIDAIDTTTAHPRRNQT